MFPCIIIHIK